MNYNRLWRLLFRSRRHVFGALLSGCVFPFGLIIGLSISSAPGQTPPPNDVNGATNLVVFKTRCYAVVGPLLKINDGKLTPEVRAAYLNWASNSVVNRLRQNNQSVPEACLAEVRDDAILREAMFGAVFPPDPSILQNYAHLRAEMGADFMRKYRSLAIATAVAKRTKGVQGAGEFGREYQSGFWVSESLQAVSSEPEKQMVAGIAEFMKAKHVAAIDLYQKPASQRQLAAFLKERNVATNLIAEVKKSVQFGERLKNALVVLGERPAARDPNPDTITWLRHLISIYESTPTSTPTVDGKVLSWPRFPITEAPWPLLMPLERSVPINEANYVWETFQGQHGDDRYHTYGPFREDADAMQYELHPSQWFWDAWPDRLEHGGTCVFLSKATVDFYLSLGEPAVWAGQPGHANLIAFKAEHGSWRAVNEQAFAGGPDKTFAQWYFDEEPRSQMRFRDLYDWAGAEYHLGLALAMNVGLESYMDTRLAAHIFATMPARDKPTIGEKLLQHAIDTNPYNPEVWYRLAREMPDAISGLPLAQAAVRHDPGGREYWQTVTEFVTRYAIFTHPIPRRTEDIRSINAFLQNAHDATAGHLAQDAVIYNLALAEKGDAEGQFLMGRRFRDGNGVPKDSTKAKQYFARSAAQGNTAASSILEELTAVVQMDQIKVTVSSQYSPEQAARHLVDRSGLKDGVHDNNGAAKTMWQSIGIPDRKPPANGLPPSPAWVRFDFAQPQKLEAIQIWNHNQQYLTDRGFQKTRICGSADNVNWFPMCSPEIVTLPRASGAPGLKAVTITNSAAGQMIKSVIIAAEQAEGNYGSDYYGLSAVRFLLHRD